MKAFLCLITLLSLLACEPLATVETGKRYESSVFRTINAFDHSTGSGTCFSDMNAEFGFKLFTDEGIGFAGPFHLANEQKMEEHDLMSFSLDLDGKNIVSESNITQYSEAGMLFQGLDHSEVFVALRLFFVSSSIAVLDIQAQNKVDSRVPIFFTLPNDQQRTVGLANYPPHIQKSSEISNTKQRITLLPYEHRSLQWIVEYDPEKGDQTASPLPSNAAKEAYLNNCAIWKRRNVLLGHTSYPQLASRCLTLLFAGKSSNSEVLQDAVLAFPDIGNVPAVHHQPSSMELEELNGDGSANELALLKDPDRVAEILATLLMRAKLD